VRLRALAPAKVNLCLFVGPTRSDGRHELVTLYQSVSLADRLELETLATGADEIVCPEVPDENLAARALGALRARGWAGPAVRVTIEKRIPVAGGMAGGSADAAAVLRLATALLPGRPEEVEQVAAELGADVPAQLAPGVALGTGAGEVVEWLEPLAPLACAVIPMPLELSTPEVYREADRLGVARTRADLDARLAAVRAAVGPAARLPSELIVNDLEPAAISLCPAIGEALKDLRSAGAEHAIVSGSGPTVVGLWWGDGAQVAAEQAARGLRARYARVETVVPVEPGAGVPEVI
jgi:4-diphosphocytidyl-2-C-methyl-D-erythritol kinase